MAKRKVVGVDVMERGLFMVDLDPKECDFCDEKKVCASINTIANNVICVCKDCLQKFVEAFDNEKVQTSWEDIGNILVKR